MASRRERSPAKPVCNDGQSRVARPSESDSHAEPSAPRHWFATRKKHLDQCDVQRNHRKNEGRQAARQCLFRKDQADVAAARSSSPITPSKSIVFAGKTNR